MYVRKVRVDLISCNTLRLTNFLYQRDFVLQEGYNWFDLVNLKRTKDDHEDLTDLIKDTKYLLAAKKEGASVGSTIFGYDVVRGLPYEIDYVCCGPDFRKYNRYAVIEVRLNE